MRDWQGALSDNVTRVRVRVRVRARARARVRARTWTDQKAGVCRKT